jgi:hypothetical protein
MLDDQMKTFIGISFIAILIVLPFAMHVKDRLAEGKLNTAPLHRSIWASFLFGGSLAILPGQIGGNEGSFIGMFQAIAFYLSLIGVVVLPFVALIIASYSFGYLFWVIGGRARTLRSEGPSEKVVSERPKVRFGKRNRPPE